MAVRLPEDETNYADAIANGDVKALYDEVLVYDFRYWRVVKNRYPHSRVAEVNDMLVLKREASKDSITIDEWIELLTLIDFLNRLYDQMLFNFQSMRSDNSVPHFHLYRLREEYR